MTEPRFVRLNRTREEWAEEHLKRAQTELDRGCVDCGKAWELHFRKGSWKGCGL